MSASDPRGVVVVGLDELLPWAVASMVSESDESPRYLQQQHHVRDAKWRKAYRRQCRSAAAKGDGRQSEASREFIAESSQQSLQQRLLEDR